MGAQPILWSEALSVGVSSLDGQHKGLIHLINQFGTAHLSSEDLAQNLEALIVYAARHFNDEEDYVLANRPDLLTAQAHAHADFIETAYDFAHRFHEGEGAALQANVFAFLCRWLIEHIQTEDQQYHPAHAAPSP